MELLPLVGVALLVLSFGAYLWARNIVSSSFGPQPSRLVSLETGLRALWARRMENPAAAWIRWAGKAHYLEQGRNYLDRAVALNDPDAHFEMGLYYLESGQGTGGQEAAIPHFVRAAEMNHPEAAYRLADILRWKARNEEERHKSEGWYLRSAELGFTPAIRWLARAYETGDDVAVDLDAAARWSACLKQIRTFPPLRRSAVAGQKEWNQWDPLVRFGCSVRSVFDGALGPYAEKSWFPWVLVAAALGALALLLIFFWMMALMLWKTPFALPLLAVLVPTVLMWLILARSIRKGMHYSRDHLREEQAALAGDADACFRMGRAAEAGIHPVPKDPTRAVEWYQRAAQAGHVEAMVRLADLLYWGTGGRRDREGATQWLQRAAAAGHAEAARKLQQEGLLNENQPGAS